MKYKLLLTFLTVFIFSFTLKEEYFFDSRKVKEGLYVDADEITIADYYVFLDNILEDSIDKNLFKELLPDKSKLRPEVRFLFDSMDIKWEMYDSDNSTFKNVITVTSGNCVLKQGNKYYGAGAAYYSNVPVNMRLFDFPITGVSYEQARYYCLWRTEVINQIRDTYGYGDNYICRLPAEKEWMDIYQAGMQLKKPEYIIHYQKGKNDKGCQVYNYNNPDVCENDMVIRKAYGQNTYPVSSYFPNSIGVTDMNGNVAEMVAEKGIAKGGSYKNSPAECQPKEKQMYEGAEEWLGFRCVIEKVK